MDQLSQEHRLISISSPLKKDELLLTSFQGGEYISRLFEFQLEVLSANVTLDPQKLVGELVTVTLQNDKERIFTGYVSRFSFGEIKANDLRQYKLTIVPWLWFLTKTNNQRIFQEMNTKDIVSKIFKEHGFNDFDFMAQGGKTREYCVQYNESDFDFISRLLEDEGIAYYFKHEKNKHKLYLVDKQNAYEYCDENEVTYSKGNQNDTQITQWEHCYEFRKGEWTINDYNFKDPKKKLIISSKTKNKFSNVKNYEHYEYPSMYDTTDGESLIKVRMEAEEAAINTIEATSDCSSFYAGGKFKLTKHAAKSEKDNYIITGIYHRAFDNSYFTGSEGQSEYGNNFVCIPADVHFRPLRTQTKPIMKGPQSAIVTGPAGEEIYIDEYGRIKVQFFWDREGELNESTTCFIRVMQPWAGKKWGTSFIPRIGMEVIINFLNGDPDRPLVTGSVYNKDNMPPYASKTQSGIKTHSTKSGTAANYNELRFEDLKGSEQIYLHAEKNLDSKVENDETHTIDKNRTKTIGENERSSIGKNRDKNVAEDQSENIGKNKKIDVGENHSETIGKNMNLKVGNDLSENIGKNLSIVAGDQIVLKTGAASITMNKNGDITIKGKNIVVQGSSKINIKASSTVAIKGSKVTTN